MTCKELLYVEDALGHESIMKNCACQASNELKDVSLSSYLKELETLHNDLFNNFLNLL